MTRSDGTCTLYSYYNDKRIHQVTLRVVQGQADRVASYDPYNRLLHGTGIVLRAENTLPLLQFRQGISSRHAVHSDEPAGVMGDEAYFLGF